MYTWFLLLLLLLCLHVVFRTLYWRPRKHFQNLPSYSELPFLGSMHWFFGGGKVLSNPNDLRAVSNAFLEKPYFYNFAREWLGEGLLLVPGEVWKRNVRKVAGTLIASKVDGFQEVFNTAAQELVKSLKLEVGKKPFDAMPYLSLITFRVICQIALGVNYTSDSKITREYHAAFVSALELMIKRGTNWLLHFDCLYRITADYTKFLKALSVMHSMLDRVIREKKLERQSEKHKNDFNTESNKQSSEFKTILNMLLDLSGTDHMSDSQIRAELNTIIVGGQETVASTLFYSMLMLGCNAEIQNTLYAEIKQVFGNSDTIDREALSRLVYCEAVISETLRLYPPIPAVTRYADRDLELQSCKIPKGTFCSLNLWGTGRSQRVWGPDAEECKPGRWLPPRMPNTSAYMPFSTGRRACIGKRYAMAFLKTFLAHCVKDLIFISDAENLEFKMDVALRATKGYLLQLKLRN